MTCGGNRLKRPKPQPRRTDGGRDPAAPGWVVEALLLPNGLTEEAGGVFASSGLRLPHGTCQPIRPPPRGVVPEGWTARAGSRGASCFPDGPFPMGGGARSGHRSTEGASEALHALQGRYQQTSRPSLGHKAQARVAGRQA